MIAASEASSAKTLPMMALRSCASPDSSAAAETLSAWLMAMALRLWATSFVAFCQSASVTGTVPSSRLVQGPRLTSASSAVVSRFQASLAVRASYAARISGSRKGAILVSSVR
ncbi:hypothetical protein KIPE111705_45075 [Kibdelosporangium persicum]